MAAAEDFVEDRLSRGDDQIPMEALIPLVDDWQATITDVASELSVYWDPDRNGDDDLDDQLGLRYPAADMALDAHRQG